MKNPKVIFLLIWVCFLSHSGAADSDNKIVPQYNFKFYPKVDDHSHVSYYIRGDLTDEATGKKLCVVSERQQKELLPGKIRICSSYHAEIFVDVDSDIHFVVFYGSALGTILEPTKKEIPQFRVAETIIF